MTRSPVAKRGASETSIVRVPTVPPSMRSVYGRRRLSFHHPQHVERDKGNDAAVRALAGPFAAHAEDVAGENGVRLGDQPVEIRRRSPRWRARRQEE